jgi:hypothetical protein
MKNFSELLATKLELCVVVNGEKSSVGLLNPLTFDADSTVTIDEIEILPKYRYLACNGVLAIPEPFYRWYHRISGQGWLLNPQ